VAGVVPACVRVCVMLCRYGAFADDVLDMVLVDPALLINADPAAAPPAPAVKASRKKQQRLLQEQQQQQQQQQLGQQEQLQQGLQTRSAAAESTTTVAAGTSTEAQEGLQQAADAANMFEAELEQQPHEQSQSAAAAADDDLQDQQQQQHAAEEPWQAVLRMRLERRQAAKELRRLQLQQERQQLEQQLRLRDTTSQQQQQRVVMPRSRGGSSRQSPVRRLLGFAGATGLSPDQALQLWQQEPSLSQLPAAAVARQVAELSQALGLLDGPTSSSGSSENKVLAAIAADRQQQQQQQSWSIGPSAGSDKDSSSSSGFSRPVLQVLVKEPLLLALSQEQLADNMQGLCDLLGLQAAAAGAGSWQQGLQQPGSLLPLLWEHPGLLLLPPEVAEYRLQHLAGLLQLSVPRTLQLMLQQPQLLTERPVLLAARLGSLCTMLGVARGVASECVLREPRVLCVEEGELQGRWDALVGRFGWAPDALDVVMADPAALMRDSLDE